MNSSERSGSHFSGLPFVGGLGGKLGLKKSSTKKKATDFAQQQLSGGIEICTVDNRQILVDINNIRATKPKDSHILVRVSIMYFFCFVFPVNVHRCDEPIGLSFLI